MSKRLFALARDNNLWRLHCYGASSTAKEVASGNRGLPGSLVTSSTTPISQLGQDSLRSLIQPRGSQSSTSGPENQEEQGLSLRKRLRAAADWDPSFENEDIDWYSEYIARHGPISFSWLQQPLASGRHAHEIKGLGLLRDWTPAQQERVVAPLDDGSVCVWDLTHRHQADSKTKGKILGVSARGLLTTDQSRRKDNPASKSALEFINVGECVSVDSIRRRAYMAVGNVLNEVDLETLKLVSQQRYPWSIFALSQETDYSVPLTLATTLSLHIYDCRLPVLEEEEAISLRCEKSEATSPGRENLHAESPVLRLRPNGRPPHRIRSPDPSDKGANYAPLFQPGPLSVLHPPAPHVNSIILAGRFPSILSYDRRFFPRLQSTVHSGGRLCGLSSVPSPQLPVFSDSRDTHNVVACGEYNGKGSLELYKLSATDSASDVKTDTSSDLHTVYHNRQSAARSKLLSVGSHGTRLAYSDGDGNIKWVERDGRAEVRRWNINSYHPDTTSTAQPSRSEATRPQNNEVARKLLPTGGNLTSDELLLWTGDRIGRLRFSHPTDPEENNEEDDDAILLDDRIDDSTREDIRKHRRHERHQEREYDGMMREALERQADEVRWVGRLGMA